MKVLIWLGCFVVVTVVLALVTEMGFELGGVPTALLCTGGAAAGRVTLRPSHVMAATVETNPSTLAAVGTDTKEMPRWKAT